MKADLTKEQISQAWAWNHRGNQQIILDPLGAKIEQNQYNQNSEFGWCVEYVISPDVLQHETDSKTSPFTQENIRVLFIKNYHANDGHKPGNYMVMYTYVTSLSKMQILYRFVKVMAL